MGPVELADVVGLDVCDHVGEIVAAALGRASPDLAQLKELVAAGKLGRKSGEGFYRWVDGKAGQAAGGATRPPADLADRLLLAMLNECVACLREGVVEDADLLDAGVIFGTGLRAVPRWAPALRPRARCRRSRGPAAGAGRCGTAHDSHRSGLGPPGVNCVPPAIRNAVLASGRSTTVLACRTAVAARRITHGVSDERRKTSHRRPAEVPESPIGGDEEGQHFRARQEGVSAHARAGPPAVQGRRKGQAHRLADFGPRGDPRGRPRHCDDPRRHSRGTQPAVQPAAAAVHGARRGRDRVPLDRQRTARRDDHLGPDRHLRGR